MLGEERRLEREPEREREAPRSGLEALRVPCTREPSFRVTHRGPGAVTRRCQCRVRDAPKGPVDLGGEGREPARFAAARRRSSERTFVVPSQIGSTWASRRRRGRPVFST